MLGLLHTRLLQLWFVPAQRQGKNTSGSSRGGGSHGLSEKAFPWKGGLQGAHNNWCLPIRLVGRSISTVHDKCDDLSLGVHPLATQFLRRLRRSLPSRKLLLPSWDLLVVLRACCLALFEPVSSADLLGNCFSAKRLGASFCRGQEASQLGPCEAPQVLCGPQVLLHLRQTFCGVQGDHTGQAYF